jgi:hypothetical protein
MELRLSDILKDPEGFMITNDKGETILSIDGYYMDEDNKSNYHPSCNGLPMVYVYTEYQEEPAITLGLHRKQIVIDEDRHLTTSRTGADRMLRDLDKEDLPRELMKYRQLAQELDSRHGTSGDDTYESNEYHYLADQIQEAMNNGTKE